MIDEENQIFYIVFENDKEHRTKAWWYLNQGFPDEDGRPRTKADGGRFLVHSTGLNIRDKAYTWSRDDSGIFAAGWGKIDVEEIFVGDVYFDKSLKARVKILNKSEKDAITCKGTDSKSWT